MAVGFTLNGELLTVDSGEDRSLLEVVREEGGVVSAKDGCAPQGQCGCCTVLVDGRARVACVTPVRRVDGREVTTLEGLPEATAQGWAAALLAKGGSQCGYCTPGIIMRLEDRRRRGARSVADAADGTAIEAGVRRALAAHLCRCTGWQGITEAAVEVIRSGAPVPPAGRDATRRATIESGGHQRVDLAAVLGRGGFAADTAPGDCLVAVMDAEGNWVVGESPAQARAAAGKVQGRRTTLDAVPPLEAAAGDWSAVLRTSWCEPGYLETDASWCEPGGEPADPVANGGAFGAKEASPLPTVARRLADEHGRTVLALWSREDSVRLGPKRPPVAIAMSADGSGIARVAATAGVAEAVALAAPGLSVQEVPVPGPPTSTALRAAGWAEAFCASVAAAAGSPLGGSDGHGVVVSAPGGGTARVHVHTGDGEQSIRVRVEAGDPLDEAVVRSYVTGAVHMAAGWVCSEGLAVDAEGSVHDLTVRSFGILAATAMPRLEIEIGGAGGRPVAVGDAVFVATAAALWRHHGFPPDWPLRSAVL